MKPLLSLFAWAVLSLLVAGFSIEAVPPGGVSPTFYIVFFTIPFAVYKHAKRLSIAICYGLLCGYFFSYLVVFDVNMEILARNGHVFSQAEILTKLALFTNAMTVACILAYASSQNSAKRAGNASHP